ncbi:MAG: hypothetical protein RL065_661 [Bacteroidota bacterium]
MKVAIVGGGIAGLAAALTLKSKGIAFHLYEQCGEFKEVGAGVLLNKTTFELLQILGVGDLFSELSNPIQSFKITDLKSELTCDMKIGQPMYAIHRADLIKVLCSSLNDDEYTLGCRIEKVVSETDKVKIQINESIVDYDVLIVANGINSNIRKAILPKIELRNVGQVVYRGISKIKGFEKYNHSAVEFWGENKRFTVIHSKDDLYYWCTVLWQKDKINDDTKSFKTNLISKFKNFHQDVCAFIDASDADKIIITNTHDIAANMENWYNARIVFVGDAVHCCTPDLSQGACLAIESAYTISRCLSEFDSVNMAFEKYQNVRMPKVNYVKNLSFKYGRLSHQRELWHYVLLFWIIHQLPNWMIKKMYNKLTDTNTITSLFQDK